MTNENENLGKDTENLETKETTEIPVVQNEPKAKLSYEDLLDMLQRSQANLENFRKQTEKRIDDIRDFAKRDVIMKFIPMLDSFDLAIKAMTKETSPEVKEGMGMIRSQLLTTLKDLAVEEIKTKGLFSPLLHEALSKVPSDRAEGIILDVFQHGYQLHGKVLRPARVQISAGKSENKD